MVGDPELERHSAPARGADTPVCDGCYPCSHHRASCAGLRGSTGAPARTDPADGAAPRLHRRYGAARSEEHTSELQSLMRISYAVFCLKKKTKTTTNTYNVNSLHTHHIPYSIKYTKHDT